MRTIGLLAFASVVPATAFAWDSTVDNVEFKGETTLFQGAEYAQYAPIDWLPVTVGFSVDANAKVGVDMKAHSDLSWPTALTHQWEGITRGGTAKLDATASVNVTLVNTDTGSTILSFPITGYAWAGEEKFDSLLLPGGVNVAGVDIIPTDFIRLDYTFDDVAAAVGFDGFDLDLTVGVKLTPDCHVDISGTKVSTDGVDITSRTGEAVLDLPSSHNGKYPLTSAWEGVASGYFDINIDFFISASGDINIPEMSFTITSFDLAQSDGKFAATTAQYTHPLPAINVRSSVDFGDVEVGGEPKEIEIPVQNLGNIDLEGDVTFDGDAAFQIVGTDEILVNGNASDVIVVEFLPEEGGDFEGTLVFATNDPMMPEVEVPVFGTGIAPEVDDDNNEGGGNGDLETRGCGCNTTPAAMPFGVFAASMLGMLARRRRKA
jgi:MYXO-CTERM domain-containing protein